MSFCCTPTGVPHESSSERYEFLRPVIIDYVESRLAEGASVATVRLEMSAVRGLFQFALDMGASDVMINPAKNVKVRKPKTGVQGGFEEQSPHIEPPQL